MAKQTGIFPISGKLGGQSWYETKSHEKLVRSIPVGFGERVKTEPAFANTRKNAAEFQWAASVAGQLVGVVYNRWRYILKPSSVGWLTKQILAIAKSNGDEDWGERKVAIADQPKVTAAYNKLSKNPLPADLLAYMANCIYYDGSYNLQKYFRLVANYWLPAEYQAYLIRKGATHIKVALLSYNVNMGEDPKTRVSTNIWPNEAIELNATEDVKILDAHQYTLPLFIDAIESEDIYTGVCVVLLPCKQVGTDENDNPVYSELQQLCSGGLVMLNYGTIANVPVETFEMTGGSGMTLTLAQDSPVYQGETRLVNAYYNGKPIKCDWSVTVDGGTQYFNDATSVPVVAGANNIIRAWFIDNNHYEVTTNCNIATLPVPSGTGEYRKGEQAIIMSAEHIDGYTFSHYTDGNGVIISQNATYVTYIDDVFVFVSVYNQD